MSQLIGTCLGDFHIVREIGRGGMGIVYEARQLSLNRRVALKVLTGIGLTPRAVDRFRREAEAAAGLHHTHIVPVYATGEHDGTHYYAMELIDGPSLDRVLARAPGTTGADLALTGPYAGDTRVSPLRADSPPPCPLDDFDAVARLLAGVADALQYAHDHGVIHRDVKPANLLVSPDGRLSLNDFGLARLFEQPGMTMTGELVGTPVYMSPEQIASGRTPVDGRTDVYSLGATLYEVLAGRPPFTADRRDQLLAQVLTKEPPPPRRLNPRVPIDLETICLKALEKDPDRRYRTAGEMADDLRRFVNRFAIAARRAGLVARVRKWSSRHPALAATLACAAAALLVAGGFAYTAHLARKALRQTERTAAVEKAMLLAVGGDIDGAESATLEAERLGASPARVNVLRGLILNHRGDYHAAIRHLRQAVALEPDNLSARALLASAFIWSGRREDYEAAAEGLDRYPARSDEDRAFLALAQSYADPQLGLATLDRATARQTTPLARFVRAQVRADCAMDTADPGLARLAVRDAVASKEAMPTTCGTLNVSAFAHLVAVKLIPDRTSTEYRDLLRSVQEDTAALERRCGHLPESVRLRWAYLDHIGELDRARDLLVAAPKKADDLGLAAGYGLAKFSLSQRDGQEALATLGGKAERSEWLDQVRAILRTDRPGTGGPDGYRAFQDLRRDYHSGTRELGHVVILDLLGMTAESRAFHRTFLDAHKHLTPFTKAGIEYCLGPPDAHARLLAAAAPSRRRLTEAHCTIALAYLSHRNRAEAMRHFQRSLDAGQFYGTDYLLSRTFLTRLKKDPAWPKNRGPATK